MESYAKWIMRLLGLWACLGGIVIVGETGVGRASSEGILAQPPGVPARGKDLYDASCVVCHGPQGKGGVGPKLAGNPVPSDEQAFWKVVHEGRHVMPPLKGTVTDEQMTDIRAWLKSLP